MRRVKWEDVPPGDALLAAFSQLRACFPNLSVLTEPRRELRHPLQKDQRLLPFFLPLES